jgi:hypothetical protein
VHRLASKHVTLHGTLRYSGAWVSDKQGNSHAADHTYHVGPHVMIITPHNEDLEKFSHDGSNGQPYVAHLPMGEVPESILHFVTRTREHVILDDAAANSFPPTHTSTNAMRVLFSVCH